MAVLALGYGVDALAQLRWVGAASRIYWGDIDTHGYAILHQARASLGNVDSVLMDEATFHRFSPLWVDEKSQHPATAFSQLTEEESQLHQALRQQRWGTRLRLEQERIAWDYVWPALVAACGAAGASGSKVQPSYSRMPIMVTLPPIRSP